ncbi:EAL domain-containing protein [Rhizobium sp. ARZ01]|nr:EAL domain-containing protein [Rhizobium sp. ARZ01]
MTDRYGKIAFVNSRFCMISGYASEELIGKNHRVVNSGHHPKDFFADMWRRIAAGEVWHGEVCNRTKSGTLYWVDTTIVPVADRSGRTDAYVSIRYDITDRKLTEQALQAEVARRGKAEALLVDVIETIPDGVAAFDADDRLVLHNRAFEEIYSLAREAIVPGSTYASIVQCGLENGQYILPRNTPEAREAWFQSRLREHSDPGRKSVVAITGGRWLQIQERRSASGHTVGTRTDITELKRSEAAIKFHAEHDPLTNLFNRSVLEKRLEQAVSSSHKSGMSGALIVADLDGFKQVNDTMGHAAGDALLIAVAQRMQQALRKTDTIVRLGGDEFALILSNASRTNVDKTLEKLRAKVQQPVSFQKHQITPRLSLGGCLFPRDGRRPESLLKKADLALYQAKAEGRGRHKLYSRAMSAESERRYRMANALAAAVSANQIDIALQPQFLIADGSHAGFEVLARWSRAGQPINPADFIAVAEAHGLIVELGHQILRKTFETVQALRSSGLNTGQVAINVAAAQIRRPEFPVMLRRMVADSGLTPQCVEVELTENILLDAAHDQVAQTLAQLHGLGFSIALDDFGTGYASLAHLRRFPVDRIKIDRTFVRDMSTSADAFRIVHATVGLAHSLGMQVVAEGIETEEQLNILRSMDCDFGQGFLVSPPLARDALPGFLAAHP